MQKLTILFGPSRLSLVASCCILVFKHEDVPNLASARTDCGELSWDLGTRNENTCQDVLEGKQE